MPAGYMPEMWQVKKDSIYFARSALKLGIEYAESCLAEHDQNLGRTIRKNKIWAETMEQDILQMKKALEGLTKERD